MLDNYCQAFVQKSIENYQLYEFLSASKQFITWQVVAIFYSSLCFVKAYLYKKGIPINSINSHDCIKFYLANETYAKQNNILQYYEVLYRNSRDARYSNKTINQERLNYVLQNYEKVKELLERNYQ